MLHLFMQILIWIKYNSNCIDMFLCRILNGWIWLFCSSSIGEVKTLEPSVFSMAIQCLSYDSLMNGQVFMPSPLPPPPIHLHYTSSQTDPFLPVPHLRYFNICIFIFSEVEFALSTLHHVIPQMLNIFRPYTWPFIQEMVTLHKTVLVIKK